MEPDTLEQDVQAFKKNFVKDGRVFILPETERFWAALVSYVYRTLYASHAYSEAELDYAILAVCDDYVTVRRELVDRGYFTRTPDGRVYAPVASA